MIYKNYVGGTWVEGAIKKTFQNINPATGEVIAEFQDSVPLDVDRAVESAHDSFRMWKNTPAPKRGEILYKASELLIRDKDEIIESEVQPSSEITHEPAPLKVTVVPGCTTELEADISACIEFESDEESGTTVM